MRSTLLTRLLAATLTIAATGVLTTAWLASQATTERIEGEFARTLEADGFIYGQLTAHAAGHPDWQAVAPLLAELARRTGRHVALGDKEDPDFLAVDPAGQAVDPDDVPNHPVAVIDAFAPLLDAAPSKLGPLDFGEPPTALSQMSDERREELRNWAVDTGDCLVARGFEADVWPADDDALLGPDLGEDGLVQNPTPPWVDDDPELAPPRIFVEAAVPWSVISDCDALPLGREGEATETKRLRAELGEHVRRCLSGRAIAYVNEVVPRTPAGGFMRVIPLPRDAEEEEEAATCEQAALRQVLGPHVAAPAQLYLWDEVDDSLLSRVGGGRLLLAVLTVLLVTAAATVLSGLRLVRPLTALTQAAERLAAGDRSTRSRLSRPDEIGRLGTAFDTMAATLEEAEHRRRLMVSDVAHELRNPVTNIVGHLDAADEGVIAMDPELVHSLQEEAALLERLIDDLQQLALAEAGQLRLDEERIDAAEIIRQVVGAHNTRARAADVELQIDHAPPTPLFADPSRLRQVLGNLVSNAIRHTPAGGMVTVTCRTRADQVLLAVEDTGVGIDPAHLPHVFDRFYRVDASRSRSTGGSGIGLALVRALVEVQGGTVEVASELGRGSTFTVSLPLTREATLPKEASTLYRDDQRAT